MLSNRKNSALPSAFGFLTVVGDQESGFVGGLLLLDDRGRPQEFHCSAPVCPNRAQVILYGPTLRPFIVGDQLATTLTAKVKRKIAMLWTDDPDVLSVRRRLELPVAMVSQRSAQIEQNSAPTESASTTFCRPAADSEPRGVTETALSDFTIHADFPEDQALVQQRWAPAAEYVDLGEPFDRIHEAIREAMQDHVPEVAS